MAVRERIERPAQTIKSVVAPLSNDLKVKIATAFQAKQTFLSTKLCTSLTIDFFYSFNS